MNKDAWKEMRSHTIKAVTMCCWFLLTCWEAGAQCALDTNAIIQEVDTINLIFEVEGATNNDLSDPSQGLCKVRLHFEHEFLGDLRLFLTSPGGQSVQLIGSEGNFGLTQFTEWNVCFIPDSEVPVPDPGFSPDWSNNQVWGSFGSLYTGSYHPFQGRLEDFNMGPVNGPWTITAQDRTIFYEGVISGIELVFCDDDGLSCNPCEPGIPEVVIDRDVFCKGEDIDVTAALSWVAAQPDQDLYSQRVFLLDESNNVLDTGLNLRQTSPIVGRYLVCATSYYEGDTSAIPNVGESWTSLQRRVNEGDVCAAISTCQEVLVLPSDTTRVQRLECGVDSVLINGRILDSSGRYFINEVNRFGCDSVIALDLVIVNFDFNVTVEDSLDCDTDSVLVVLTEIEVEDDYEVEWRHEQGFLLDTISRDSALAFVAGEVQAIITSRGCPDTIRTQVVRDSTIPEAQVFGDTLSCEVDSVLLTSITTAGSPTYMWSRGATPLGASEDSLRVGQPGVYSLIVTDDNGCSARASYEVRADTLPVPISFQKDTSVCPGDSLGVALTGKDSLMDPLWSGPLGFSARGQSIRVFEEGWYFVEGIGKNGCVTTDSILLTKGLSADSIFLGQIPIECLASGRLTFWDFGPPLSEFTWITPQGRILRDSFVITDIPGQYVFSSISSNGCSSSDTIILQDNRVFPTVNLDVDSIECFDDIGYARQILDPSIARVSWITPMGDTTTNDSILLTGSGWYHIEVTGVNGCVSSDSFEINAGRSPVIEVFGDTIRCDNRGSSRVWAVSNQNGLSYSWSRQGGIVGVDSVLAVNEGGWYKCSVSNAFGCEVMDSFLVIVDTVPPMVIAISPDTLTCRNEQVEIRTFVMPNLVQYSWTGPLGFLSTAKNPIVQHAGDYKVVVTSVNGCSDSTRVSVLIDTVAPDPQVVVDTITCDSPSVRFNGDTISANWSWTWISPEGDTAVGYPHSTMLAGNHKLTVENVINGCLFEDEIEVEEDVHAPRIMLRDTFIGCGDSSIIIMPQNVVSFREIFWSGPSGFFSDSLRVSLVEEGEYIVELIGENGCIGRDSFSLQLRNRQIQVELRAENIDCRRDFGMLESNVTGPILSEFWITPSGQRVDQRSFESDEVGVFTFVGVSVDGCRDSLQIQLTEDTIGVPVSLLKDGDFICERDFVSLNLDTILHPLLYDLILTNESGDTLQWNDWNEAYGVRTPGEYTVEVVTKRNGCLTSDSLVISRLDDPILDLDLLVNDVLCPEVSDGQVDILAIAGGYPPYRTQFNGLDFGQIRSFDRLRAGDYSLIVTDTFGCKLDTVIQLGLSDLPLVDAGKGHNCVGWY